MSRWILLIESVHWICWVMFCIWQNFVRRAVPSPDPHSPLRCYDGSKKTLANEPSRWQRPAYAWNSHAIYIQHYHQILIDICTSWVFEHLLETEPKKLISLWAAAFAICERAHSAAIGFSDGDSPRCPLQWCKLARRSNCDARNQKMGWFITHCRCFLWNILPQHRGFVVCQRPNVCPVPVFLVFMLGS